MQEVKAPYKLKKFQIRPQDSQVKFTGFKQSACHDGGFKSFRGTVEVVEGDPERSTVIVEIDTGSIYADVDELTQHLKTEDFFDIAKFPVATFESTKVSKAENGGYTITGMLNLLGKTERISFPADIQMVGETIKVKAEFQIDRKLFGLDYPGMPDDLIRDHVQIHLDVTATPMA